MSDERVVIVSQLGPRLGQDWDRFIKRPVTIRAKQFDVPFEVETLEGTMRGEAGDYCIIGIAGEVYPCKREIFEKTYDPHTWDAA